tara:strand:+ start:122 stop:397 length:276 start_codon:yes stop_codon:yes gene_type:complete
MLDESVTITEQTFKRYQAAFEAEKTRFKDVATDLSAQVKFALGNGYTVTNEYGYEDWAVDHAARKAILECAAVLDYLAAQAKKQEDLEEEE